MKPILLIDFGSTYTKVTAVDPDQKMLIGSAQSFTTVTTDISTGLDDALRILRGQIGSCTFSERYACSSAAGGLRMIASGLVPTLTAEAAKRAALGAGAKVIKTYAYELTDEDVEQIEDLRPDILLLCGGTDGGNRACIEHNAYRLALSEYRCPIVLAGNRASASICNKVLSSSGREVIICENVMPTFNKLNTEPCQKVIRDLFLRRIISAKGLSKAQALISGILMPTPSAVLSALTLLSRDLGELMAVDLGGATTDIYSITEGLPSRAGTIMTGLPEPFAKRTVEGDIGMRYSVRGIVDALGIAQIVKASARNEAAVTKWLNAIAQSPDILPATEDESAIDRTLARFAIELGLIRHAGTIKQIYTPMGVAYQQTGKDLTRVSRLIVTGGALVRTDHAEIIAEKAMETTASPDSLIPRNARICVDKQYLLSAMGVLSQNHESLARNLMTKEFV